MSRSGASMEALIGLAKQKLKEKNKEKKEAEAAAKLKSTAAKKRPFEEVKDIFMDPTIESKEDSPKDSLENVKESKSKKKKVSPDLPKEDENMEKEPEVKVEEVPANPIDAIMKEIASLQADVETFEKIKKVKKAKKRKRKHSSSSSSSDESDDEPSVELEEKVEEEEIAVEVKGQGSLVTGYDSDEFEDDENFELSKPKVAEMVLPKAAPNLDDDFIFLKPTIPANMIPPQVAGGPKREKAKKIGLCDRLMQQGGQENASAPLKPVSAKDPANAANNSVYVYNPLTGKRDKVDSKPAEGNAGGESKDAQLLSVSRSPLMSESLKDSILDSSSKGETKSVTAEPTPLKTSNSATEPQYKYNPLTGYRDLLVETKPFLGPFTVGASSVKVEKPEKVETGEPVSQPFNRKGICKFFNMKFGCRHGENCRFKHEKYKQANFNYENAYQNVQGQETRAPVMTGSLENKETDISPSEFYRTFIEKSLKQKKGAGIFFEKAKENLLPEETNMIAEKTNERIDIVKQNGFKGETREIVDNYIDDAAAKKYEKNMRKAEKNKDIVKCNREKKEIAGGIINEIIDTIFATRNFGNSKSNSRSRSSSISLSNSSDLEEESNPEARTLKRRREKSKRHQLKQKPRSKPCSRSRSRSQSRDRKKSRNSSTGKERKKSSRRKQKSRSRDRIRRSRSRSRSRSRARVLPSSYLEQVRNGIPPPEWNEEKYRQPRHNELHGEENEPNSRIKRRSDEKEEKIILPGLEELLSIEKNKECPRVLKNSIGIVTSIINESYAIAAVTLPYSKVSANERKGPFRVLFDTCEFWIENRTASDLGVSLEQVITVGDYVKVNAILIEKPNIRNINYMATATKTSDNISNLLKEKFAEEIATNDIKEVSKNKLDNFDVVVKFLSSSPITEEETKIEMKSEKDADSNLISRAREWKNWLYYNTQSSAKSSSLERNIQKLSDNLSEDEGKRRKPIRTKVSNEFREKERRRRNSRDSDEIQCIEGKSRDSIHDKNGIYDKRYNRSRESKRSSSSDDEDERDRSSRSRDKSRRNGSRSSETRKHKNSSTSRSRSRERKNKRSQEKERRTNRSRSRNKDYHKRRPSKSPVSKKHRSRSREKETERKTSRRLREEEYERKTSSRSQEKDHRRKRSDRSSEKDYKRRRSGSRERKLNGGRSKEKESKRKSSTESLVSLSGREPCARLPANFSYWNENLIKCLDDGEYIDCIHCQETLATKPEHNFLPYYLDHYSSVEHALKMVESSVCDQDCVNDYIAHSSELDYFIQLELDRGAAEVIYDEGDLRLFLCKYCQKVGTTAWHFYKLKNSKLHSPEGLRL